MKSLGLRISLALAFSQLIVLVLATWFAYRTGSGVLNEQFDRELEARAALYLSLVEQTGKRVGIDGEDARKLAPPEGAPRELVQVWKEDGRKPFYHSPGLEEDVLARPDGESEGEEPTFEDATLEGVAMRVLSTRATVTERELSFVHPDAEPAVVELTIARERTQLDQALAGLLAGLLGGAAVLLASAVLIAWAVARRGLAPLHAFGRRVGAMDVETLDQTLDPSEHARELEPVVNGLNDLRGRIDRALRREKRLNATLAHEFRTPISELRAMTSVALEDLNDVDFTRRALEQVHDVSGRLTELLVLIRQLVRVDRRENGLEAQEVRLGELLDELMLPLQEIANERRLHVDLESVDGACVRVNTTALASVCANLLGNAVHYAPEGSEVECAVHRDGDRIVLRITNPCDDLTEQEVEHLTEPFWRGSTSRSDPDHHGLGLSIASGMAALAGFELALELRDGTFVAEVLLRS